MRTPDLALVLAALGGVAGLASASTSAPHPHASFDHVRYLLPSGPLDGQEAIDPRTLPQDDPQAPTVSLAQIDDALALERQLRDLVRAPYGDVRIQVPRGRVQLGHFSVGSSETLDGHLLVVRGRAEVYGRVEGNLVALDGDVLVHRGAVVEGDALSLGGRVRNLGGTILGETRSISTGEARAEARRQLGPVALSGMRLAGVVGSFLTLGLIGFGLVAFGRPYLETVADTASHSFLRSFLVGLLSQVLVVPTFGMLVVGLTLSVVGVLLVPFVVIVYALLVVVGLVGGFLAVAHALGETHTRRQMARGLPVSPNSFRYLLVGLAAAASVWGAWALFGAVPIAGALILGAAVIATWSLTTVGLGAAVLSRAGVRPQFAGRYLPAEMMTDEYLWATPQQGVPAVKRPPTK